MPPILAILPPSPTSGRKPKLKSPGDNAQGRKEGTATKQVGQVTEYVEKLLGLTVPSDRTIYLGPSNLIHMQTSHPEDFSKYGTELINILAYPDYVGQNPTDGSIEYVKEFQVDGEFVKVAVRLAKTDRFYARSLYVLNSIRVKNYIAKGTLKKT